MTNTKAYPAYQDSGVEWLGEIPEGWELASLGSCLKSQSERDHPDLPLLSITRERGVILRDRENEEENHNFIPDDLTNYKVLREGQFGMNKMKAWQGSYGVSSYTGIVSPAYFIFDLHDRLTPRFFSRAIRSKTYVSFFGSASDGVRIGQWDLNQDRMKRIPFFIPSPPEQRAIADYLDDKVSKIDRAIAQKERLIELLQERKQIIIQNAVTKGLDPSVKMKDSGIEWIGQIPEHWEVKRLKFVLGERDQRSADGSEPLLMMSQVHGLVLRSDFHEKAEVAASNNGNKVVRENDLVFNKLKAHLGVFFKSEIPYEGIVSPDYAVYFCRNYIEDPKFLEVLFRHPAYISKFICTATGIVEGLIRLYTSDLFNIGIPVPPPAEQREILFQIKQLKSKQDLATAKQKEQIQTLREYKATLIDSAVTGKIDVRDYSTTS